MTRLLTPMSTPSYSQPALAKSGAGIGTPFSKSAKALVQGAFFMSTLYGGLIQGASARRPLAGSSNLFKPATQSIGTDGGSPLTQQED